MDKMMSQGDGQDDESEGDGQDDDKMIIKKIMVLMMLMLDNFFG